MSRDRSDVAAENPAQVDRLQKLLEEHYRETPAVSETKQAGHEDLSEVVEQNLTDLGYID
jgi:hypothetical protein